MFNSLSDGVQSNIRSYLHHHLMRNTHFFPKDRVSITSEDNIGCVKE